MEPRRPLIAVIHATWAASAPIVDAFAGGFPEARLWQLLDDRLMADAVEAGAVTPDLRARLGRLVRHAAEGGADGVLLTCSMYAGLAEEAGRSAGIRVVPSDAAMHRAVIDSGAARCVLLFSLPTAVADGTRRLRSAVADAGAQTEVVGIVAAGALDAAGAGDWDQLVDSLAAAATPHLDADTVVALGQYSLAPVADALAARLRRRVLSAPQLAAEYVRRLADTGSLPPR